MTTEKHDKHAVTQHPAEDDHPLAGCVLHERAKRGELPNYSYPQNGLPELTVKSAPARSLFAALSKKSK